MTCGKWGQPGHETHLCTDCANLGNGCEVLCTPSKKSCDFKPATPETLKYRDEIFSRKKVRA